MKYLVRVFLFNTFALWLTSQLLPMLVITGGWQVMMSAGLFLSLLMLLVAPILKILFIPINILTFGLLSWFINVAVVYLLTLLVPSVEIRQWMFPGIATQAVMISAKLITYPFSLIISSLTITFIANLFHWISES